MKRPRDDGEDVGMEDVGRVLALQSPSAAVAAVEARAAKRGRQVLAARGSSSALALLVAVLRPGWQCWLGLCFPVCPNAHSLPTTLALQLFPAGAEDMSAASFWADKEQATPGAQLPVRFTAAAWFQQQEQQAPAAAAPQPLRPANGSLAAATTSPHPYRCEASMFFDWDCQ